MNKIRYNFSSFKSFSYWSNSEFPKNTLNLGGWYLLNLNLVNELMKKGIQNNIVQSFIKELSNYLENINEKGENELDKQDINSNLEKYRKEDRLYQVVDMSTNGVILQDTKNNVTFEETEISEDIKDKIQNDYILKYKNGEYVIEDEMTEDFFDRLVGIKEYKNIQQKFIEESDILQIDPNVRYKIDKKKDDYTMLKYGEDEKKIDVPNALLPYFTDEDTVLYYKNGKFEKDI